MYRTHTCGALNKENINEIVTLSGWVQGLRDKGNIIWIDLRDLYGITQLVLEEKNAIKEILEKIRHLGREHVIQIEGKVIERMARNPNLSTGDIEIQLEKITVLNASLTPPFTIEDRTDGGEELRMKYRYLDLRRNPLKNNLILRHNIALETRKYLSSLGFLEIETPYLIKSTPEGARDFVVPSRMNVGEFYALPQSPQMFKQTLMVSGYDRYFQIVRCFRDEDLRADRQPEFTQIDCEMAFVEQEDVLNTFEDLIKHIFQTVKGITFSKPFPRISYQEAMEKYGSDKPDIRFSMQIKEITPFTKGYGFSIFEEAEYVAGLIVSDASEWTRKQIDELTDFVKKPQIGATGLVFVKYQADQTLKSSVDKFYTEDVLKKWALQMDANPKDLLLILSGKKEKVQKQLSELRLHLGDLLHLRNPNEYAPLWVLDFPLLEKDEESGRYVAVHHPFTSPKKEDFHLMQSTESSDLLKIRANAYDLAMNGLEIGGGSIRIHNREIQTKIFSLLGFSTEEAQKQFGFLLSAFEYGAPPHGGIAFGLDRIAAALGGSDSIRDFIAFPKNNRGRDVMIDAPSPLYPDQIKELNL